MLLWKTLEALRFATLTTVMAFLVAFVVSFGAAADWVGVKTLLFLVGFFVIGYGTLRLYGGSPDHGSDVEPSDGSTLSSLVPDVADHPALVDRVVEGLPGPWSAAPMESRFPDGVRLLLAGVLILLVSYLMEAVFQVG